MEFLGVGGAELVLVLIIAGIFLGPKRIQEVARWLGKTTAELQRVSRTFTQQLNDELDAIDEGGELKAAVGEIKSVREELRSAVGEVTGLTNKALNEGKTAVDESNDFLKQTILPPTLANGTSQTPDAPPSLPNVIDVADDPE